MYNVFTNIKNFKNKRYESIAEAMNVPYGTPYLKKKNSVKDFFKITNLISNDNELFKINFFIIFRLIWIHTFG